MKVEYDRQACTGWFQCVQHWDAFDMDMIQGKADLADAEEVSGLFVRDVPEDAEEDAIAAAEACPVNAISVYDDEDELAAPTEK